MKTLLRSIPIVLITTTSALAQDTRVQETTEATKACQPSPWWPHGGGNYSQYFPAAFSSLLLNVPSGSLSMSNIALSAGV
jgi:hypothetical protein